MKKRIISIVLSVVMAISALPLLSGCSGSIGSTNINPELVKDFELNQSDIEILAKLFVVANQARNELNSKSEITNDDLEDFNDKIYDAYSPDSTESKDVESDTSDTTAIKNFSDVLRERCNVVWTDEEKNKKWGKIDDARLDYTSNEIDYLLDRMDSSFGYLPIQRYKSAVEFLNYYSNLFYGKEFIAEEEVQKVSGSNAKTSYKDNLVITIYKILSSSADAEDVCNLTRKVWKNAIYKERDTETDAFTMENGVFYDDFNDALGKLFKDNSYSSDVSSIKDDQEKITEMVKFMKDAPEEYTSAYDELKQLYTAYQTLSGLAVDSSGSYNSYSDSVRNADDDVIKCYNNLKLYLD